MPLDYETGESKKNLKVSVFQVGGRTFGIPIDKVQEIVRSLPITKLPLAPNTIVGMINLRGQIATAISTKALLEISEAEGLDPLNIVCKSNGTLVAFVVDEIGDVIEYSQNHVELAPPTIPPNVRRYLLGVLKQEKTLISLLDIDLILESLQPRLSA